jgi:MFS transporter, NNP family, nitrate/nitrite transporter
MIGKEFFKAGHTLTLFAAFFYFDMAFMVWVILGPLGVQVAADLGLNAGQKGLMVAVPILAGALLRVVNGVLVDHIRPKRTGLIGQVVVLMGLLLTWFHGVSSFAGILAVGVVLGVAGASFAVALPLASQWYPQCRARDRRSPQLRHDLC